MFSQFKEVIGFIKRGRAASAVAWLVLPDKKLRTQEMRSCRPVFKAGKGMENYIRITCGLLAVLYV